MAKNKILSLFVLGFSAVIFVSCSSGAGDSDTHKTDDDSSSSQSINQLSKAQNIFKALASPVEIATLIRKTGAPYNPSFMNDMNNKDKYTTVGKKALNLGVYGADLSMASIYDQSQDAMFYLACTNSMAEMLGIGSAFGEKMLGRVEANLSNHDSVLAIISESFLTMDTYLKENDRPNTSSVILAGGWIEGLYIACQMQRANPNDEVMQRITDQRHSISNVLEMLEACGEEEEGAKLIVEDVRQLKAAFDALATSTGKVEVSKNEKSGLTTLGGKKSSSVTTDQFSKISEITGKIRTKIVTP